MLRIQTLINKGFQPHQVLNADETMIQFGVNPSHMMEPTGGGGGGGGEGRVEAPGNDEKARFTAMLFGFASGSMGPPTIIIQNTLTKDNQSSSTVIPSLAKKEGFSTADGWTMDTWKRTISLIRGNKLEPVECVRHYLRHNDGALIFSQHKGYMDSAGLCMWCDLVLAPARRRSMDKQWLLIWDNFKSHLNPSVKEVFKQAGILLEELPVNMSDILQVMDLVVNGPLKAHLRRRRVQTLYDYFQTWRLGAADSINDKTPFPAYTPPEPSRESGIKLSWMLFPLFLRTALLSEACGVLLKRLASRQFLAFLVHPQCLPSTWSIKSIV
jgi:hypothetical protein